MSGYSQIFSPVACDAARAAEHDIAARFGAGYTPLIQTFQAVHVLQRAAEALRGAQAQAGHPVAQQCYRNESAHLQKLIQSPDIYAQRRAADQLIDGPQSPAL